MDLQNINIHIDFELFSIYSIFESNQYMIPSVSNITKLQTALDAETGFTSKTLVVQYTIDQYGKGSEPRLISSDGEQESEQRTIISLTDITESLSNELVITRAEIEIEIVNQIASENQTN